MPAMATLRNALLGGALLLTLVLLPACKTLTAGNGVITGTMSYPSGSLPAGATAVVELVRLESGYAPTVVTRTSLTPTSVSPIPFVLNYDPTTINPEIPHALRAAILSSSGGAMYATNGDVGISFDGTPVALDLYSVTGTSTPGGTTSTPRR
jgi:uncharacterized lipoprotein YbaY